MFLFRYFDTDFIREALKSRLSLGMTSNKTYHFQTTANHHRFIKVWTSVVDLTTSKFGFWFFLEKVWLRNTLPTYVQNFVFFFNALLMQKVGRHYYGNEEGKDTLVWYIRLVLKNIGIPQHSKRKIRYLVWYRRTWDILVCTTVG